MHHLKGSLLFAIFPGRLSSGPPGRLAAAPRVPLGCLGPASAKNDAPAEAPNPQGWPGNLSKSTALGDLGPASAQNSAPLRCSQTNVGPGISAGAPFRSAWWPQPRLSHTRARRLASARRVIRQLKSFCHDPPRTRTWNLRLRRPTPYPLGQRAPCSA